MAYRSEDIVHTYYSAGLKVLCMCMCMAYTYRGLRVRGSGSGKGGVVWALLIFKVWE